jgi:aquaporin Z
MQGDMSRRVSAELFGTFWLTFGGCGAAVLAAAFPAVGIGLLGVSFAFGLTVLTMAYAVGHISGGHFNPAVTLGLWSAGRCANKHVLPYIGAQVAGAILGAAVLWLIASGKPGWIPAGFAANGYGDLSPGKYNLTSCLITELVMSFFFLFIIVGTTSKGAATGFAGIPIAGSEYIGQLWMFWLAPIAGGMLAGAMARWMYEPDVLIDTIILEERAGT